MRFEDITYSPKERFKTVLETLDKEFKITLDFSDITGINKLQSIALESIEKIKDSTTSIFEEKSPRYTVNYLILEAIKLKEEIDMKKINEASEIEKAEYLLASKNIVDDLQSMIEDVSKIQAEKISSITDRIKIEQGIDAAENYKTTAASLMTALIASLSATKDGLDNLTLNLSGDVSMAQAPAAPTAPAADASTPPAMPDADEEPAPEAEEEPKKMANPLGRERKEESRSRIGKALTESEGFSKEELQKMLSDIEKKLKSQGQIVDDRLLQKKKQIEKLLKESSEKAYPNELKLFHVTCKSPDGKKLFGNYKVHTNDMDIAKHTAKSAVMKKHGMAEWNDEYKMTCVKVEAPKDNATKSPATPTTKQIVGEKGAFKKMEKAIEKTGKSPEVAAKITAAAGIKKYGVKGMEAKAQAGKKRAHESVDEPNTFDDQKVKEDFEKEYDNDGNTIIKAKPEKKK